MFPKSLKTRELTRLGRYAGALIGVIFLLTSCSQSGTPTQIATPAETAMPTATEGQGVAQEPTVEIISPPSPTAEAPLTPVSANIPAYEISAQLDYVQKTLLVNEIVTFRNPVDRELKELVFIAEPGRYSNGFELIKAQDVSGGSNVSYSLEGNLLRLELTPALPADQEVRLNFQFNLNIPAIPPPSEQYKPQPYGYTDRQTNLVDWYLFLAPVDADGEWLAHPPSYFGEYLVYPIANINIDLELVNAPDGLLVAASAENESQEVGRYIYRLTGGRSFAISLNAGYELAETSVGGVIVRSYFSRLEKSAGQEALNATTAALEVYSGAYGPYERKVLSVVEADFLDGMEYDGLYFLSKGFYNLFDGTPKGYLTIIAVHETAHQWFYGQVGNDQALEPWLDEAWCTFSELVFYENQYPDLVDWWWFFRVNYYDPIGYIDQPVYDYSGFTPYRNAVYLRGAKFLDELRDAQGEEAFYAHTKSYITKYKGKISSTRSFFEEFDLLSAQYQKLIPLYFKSAE